MASTSKDARINIVGAGIFGLSTALHLARRGYKNVTVFDKQPYDDTEYSYSKGCDAASADMNKIIRTAYGSQVEYQEMGFEAIEIWKEWNAELADGQDLPPGLTSSDRVFVNCGSLSFTDSEELHPFEIATIKTMESQGHKDTQLVTNDPRHVAIAKSRGQEGACDPFHRRKRGKSSLGVLDSSGGVTIADKACRFALHKARQLGANFVLDPVAGAFDSFMLSSLGRVQGAKTKDGKSHKAELTIMACGGLTPSLVPELDGLCEATGGSVVIYKIPKSSSLWDRTSPENFPTWLWNMRSGAEGGLYGFPRTDEGFIKVGYRGTKYTNPRTQDDGQQRSVPITRWSGKETGEELQQIPVQAMRVIRGFLDEYLPELGEEGIDVALTRVCWYTDTFDNHFVVDHVPSKEGLFVVTGGSGHAFKYLPNIGNWIVDVIEGVQTDRPAIKAWKWRGSQAETSVNVLMEGSQGSRALDNVQLVGKNREERAKL
ncbi:putative sarcosine oxidase [Clathrospora elynae]|uniref:Putative sarcosine oxidase n=1 Tax=Clathrospora elynae TaxID=706981 RepID=A0A6A5SMB9_9PLEO|nr:putative sarcosine oxidase [Clathrospora elynae]